MKSLFKKLEQKRSTQGFADQPLNQVDVFRGPASRGRINDLFARQEQRRMMKPPGGQKGLI